MLSSDDYCKHILDKALDNLKSVNIILIFEILQDDISKLSEVFNNYFKKHIDLGLEKMKELQKYYLNN